MQAGVGARGLATVALAIAAGCSDGSSNALVGSVSRGSVNVSFADAAGSNLPTSHIRANSVTITLHDAATGTIVVYIGGFVDEGGGSYQKEWDLTLGLNGEPTESLSYTVANPTSGTAGLASVLLQDGPGSWRGESGTITVTSVVGRRVDFSLDSVTMAPTPNGPVGTFSLHGVVTISDIDDVCDCLF